MTNVFNDLRTSRWWAWGGLVVFVVCLAIAVFSSPAPADRGLLIAGAWVGLLLYLGTIVVEASLKNHRHLLTVCVWSFILVVTGIAAGHLTFFSLTGSEAQKYDRILNVVPVFTAIWAAALGWFVHFRLTTKAHRTNSSFAICMELRKSAEILKRAELVSRHFPPGTQNIPQDYHRFFDSKSLQQLYARKTKGENVSDPEIEQAEAIAALKFYLNYFEFMSVGIKAGDLDEDLLYDTISTQVVKLWQRSQDFVRYLRAESPDGAGQPLAYICVEQLAARWSVRQAQHIADYHAGRT